MNIELDWQDDEELKLSSIYNLDLQDISISSEEANKEKDDINKAKPKTKEKEFKSSSNQQ